MKKIFLALLLCLIAHSAQAALAVDGTVTSGSNVCVLTTTSANDVIILQVKYTGSTTIGVSDGSSLTWTKRISAGIVNGIGLDEWYAVSPTALSSDTITVSGIVSGARCVAFGVSGANTSVPFDPNGSLPGSQSNAATSTAAVTISTNNANDMLVVAIDTLNSMGTVTRPSGYAQTVATGSFMDTSNNIVSSTISSTAQSFSWSGIAGANDMVIDAVQQASTSTPGTLMQGFP